MSKFYYMNRDRVVAEFDLDFAANKVAVNQIGEELLDRPFGDSKCVSISDFMEFLESRCFPRERHGAKKLCKSLGLDTYDPLGIVTVNFGRQWDDYYWINYDGSEKDYESIKLRD